MEKWKQKLYNRHHQLSRESYEAHPFYTLESEGVLIDGKASDCQDRSYNLADYAVQLGLKPKFLWLFWWKNRWDAHVAIIIEGKVWDATWKYRNSYDYWDYPLDIYLEGSEPDYHIITPYWIRKIIR